jgi:hypothetical protein
MTENSVSDLITDQEIAFAHLILSGTMTDRQAAEAAGLNPDTAVDTKSKPRVSDYILALRAAVQQQPVEQFHVSRDQVLTRLWDIANMDPERTRSSMSSQVKAISMIVAIEGLIPDRHSARRAGSAQNEPAPPPVPPAFYKAEWLRNQQNGESVDPQPPPAPAPEETRQEAPPEPPSGPLDAAPTTSSVPRVPMADYFAPDTRQPFKIEKNRFGGNNRFGRPR